MDQKWENSQERTDQMRAMLQQSGTLLGTGAPNVRWYVCDGKVYCDLSHTQLQYSGDYFEFMDRVRKGHLPGFTPAEQPPVTPA